MSIDYCSYKTKEETIIYTKWAIVNRERYLRTNLPDDNERDELADELVELKSHLSVLKGIVK